jgi:hypothetical protein
MAVRKRVSTTVVKCRECEFDDTERYVRIIVYEDVEVHCRVLVEIGCWDLAGSDRGGKE